MIKQLLIVHCAITFQCTNSVVHVSVTKHARVFYTAALKLVCAWNLLESMCPLMTLRQLCALREHDCRKNQFLEGPRLSCIHTHTHTAKTEATQKSASRLSCK